MIAALLILILSALVVLALGSARAYARLARVPAVLGMGAALAVSLLSEGLHGAGVAGAPVEWPPLLAWIGRPVYGSDALSAGLGAWCLLLGALCLLRMGQGGDGPHRLAAGTLVVATLYSLAHTWDLRFFAAQLVLLVILLWILGLGNTAADASNAPGERVSAHEGSRRPRLSLLALGLGAISIMAAVLLIGRTTGGEYALPGLSLSALGRWPLALVLIGSGLWLGLAPFTGWSARGHGGSASALAQSLVVGVPIATLLLRLQALVTAQGLAGSVPEGWATYTGALAWAGGITALVAGAGTILAAGAPHWTALLSAHTMGLVAWGLGLDTPLGRLAALAILLAFGAGRVAWELSEDRNQKSDVRNQMPGVVAKLSLAATPMTAGFVGVWLLGVALSQSARPSLVLALGGAVILSACGMALGFGCHSSLVTRHSSLVTILSLALIAGGTLPALWLPQVAAMASVAGGTASASLPWTGLAASGAAAPVLLLGLGALTLALIGWLVATWARSGAGPAAALLPTALGRPRELENAAPAEQDGALDLRAFPPPAPVWWLSLGWMETSILGFGEQLLRLGSRAGLGLGRLEGRYYLPLALIAALIALLVVTR